MLGNSLSSVQSLSRFQLFAALWTAAHQAPLSITNSWGLLKLMSMALVMPSNHLILCHPLLLPPSVSSQFVKKTMFDSALTISKRVIKTEKWWTRKIIMVNTNNILTKALFSPMYIYKLIFTTLKLVLLLYQSYCFCSKCVKLMQIKHNYKQGHNYEVMDMLCSLVVVITVYVYQVFTL